jgi:hypothetical protein
MAAALTILELHIVLEVLLSGAAYLAAWIAIVRRSAPEQLAVLTSLVKRK